MTRSATHRLAAALVARPYLRLTPRQGYQLGPRLLGVARRHLEALAEATEDTVHLEPAWRPGRRD